MSPQPQAGKAENDAAPRHDDPRRNAVRALDRWLGAAFVFMEELEYWLDPEDGDEPDRDHTILVGKHVRGVLRGEWESLGLGWFEKEGPRVAALVTTGFPNVGVDRFSDLTRSLPRAFQLLDARRRYDIEEVRQALKGVEFLSGYMAEHIKQHNKDIINRPHGIRPGALRPSSEVGGTPQIVSTSRSFQTEVGPRDSDSSTRPPGKSDFVSRGDRPLRLDDLAVARLLELMRAGGNRPSLRQIAKSLNCNHTSLRDCQNFQVLWKAYQAYPRKGYRDSRTGSLETSDDE